MSKQKRINGQKHRSGKWQNWEEDWYFKKREKDIPLTAKSGSGKVYYANRKFAFCVKGFIPINRDFISAQNFGAKRLEILCGDKKRNNVIDILKAGGTRISLFLLFNDTLDGFKNQTGKWWIFGQNFLPLGLRATEGAGLSLSTVKIVVESGRSPHFGGSMEGQVYHFQHWG